jgi:dehydrogenase/reductase SDR family protein 7
MWAERFGLKPDVLKGQVVWITGASSGIGRHLAYHLARVGCRLVLSARSSDDLENVRTECLATGCLNDSDILVLPFDITDNPSHAKATEKVINTFGQIDVLVNNAGRSQRAWIVDTELAVDREMIELNVIGQISLTKCVLPHMIERHCGQIVVTSSLAGKTGIFSQPCDGNGTEQHFSQCHLSGPCILQFVFGCIHWQVRTDVWPVAGK